jgi:hypothetical protein
MCVYADTQHVIESINEHRDLQLLKDMNEDRERIRLTGDTQMNDMSYRDESTYHTEIKDQGP